MERVGFVLKVRADRLEEYRARHRQVWPEMLQALRETGWRNYSLFLRDDGLLFGYVEVEDFAAALAGMAERDVNARWQAEMAPWDAWNDKEGPNQYLKDMARHNKVTGCQGGVNSLRIFALTNGSNLPTI